MFLSIVLVGAQKSIVLVLFTIKIIKMLQTNNPQVLKIINWILPILAYIKNHRATKNIMSTKKCILVHFILEDSNQGGDLLNNALNLLGLSLLKPISARVSRTQLYKFCASSKPWQQPERKLNMIFLCRQIFVRFSIKKLSCM